MYDQSSNPRFRENLSKLSQEALQDLFQSSPAPTAVIDRQGQFMAANLAFETWVDEKNGIPEGQSFFELFNDPEVADELQRRLEEGEIIRRHPLVLVDPSGEERQVLLFSRRLAWNDHPALEISLVSIDREVELKQSAQRNQAQLQSLIEGVTAGLFMVDNQGRITQFNRALSSLFGVSEEEYLARDYQELFGFVLGQVVEPEVAQRSLRRAVTAVVERPTIEMIVQGDQNLYLEWSFFPVWGEDGTPEGWGCLVQDITELRQQVAWKLELLSVLAHDIRAPLATLKGHATALLDNYRQWGDEMVREFLEIIDRNTDKLVRQVDRSLALTRVETGRLGLRPETIEVKHLIEEALEVAAGLLDQHEIVIDLPDESAKVRADPARIEEVLVNLLENAARYSPVETVIRIEVEVKDGKAILSVIDHGPGVDADQVEKVFEKYVGGQSADGTGLGLFISRKIVEAHGGRIWIEQGDGGGAKARFTLPVLTYIVEEQPSVERKLPMPKAAEDGLQILIVEDEADTQALLRSILTEAGYQTEVASGGSDAVEIAQTASPDLILMDWVMPGMDGLNATKQIRRYSNVPILLVTSKTAPEDLIAALDAGADDYVTKPFRAPELLARIQALLRRREPAQEEDKVDRFSLGGLTVNFQSHEVWLNGKVVHLTPTEFDLLTFLIRNRGRVLTYQQLLEKLYPFEEERDRHDLFVHVSRLRKKVEPDPDEPRYVVTQWGVGYLFPAE
ncbi:MAG: response regulator [Anaerolineales bacterium]|jgi:two-component system KDP operon response regulator KdpE